MVRHLGFEIRVRWKMSGWWWGSCSWSRMGSWEMVGWWWVAIWEETQHGTGNQTPTKKLVRIIESDALETSQTERTPPTSLTPPRTSLNYFFGIYYMSWANTDNNNLLFIIYSELILIMITYHTRYVFYNFK